MDNTLGFVLVSAFAVLGALYLASFFVELIFKKGFKKVFVVVPAESVDESLFELMSLLHEMGPYGEKIVLEMSPLGDKGLKLVERGYCKAVLKPYELAGYIASKYKRQ